MLKEVVLSLLDGPKMMSQVKGKNDFTVEEKLKGKPSPLHHLTLVITAVIKPCL